LKIIIILCYKLFCLGLSMRTHNMVQKNTTEKPTKACEIRGIQSKPWTHSPLAIFMPCNGYGRSQMKKIIIMLQRWGNMNNNADSWANNEDARNKNYCFNIVVTTWGTQILLNHMGLSNLSNKVSNIIRRLMDNTKLLLICILWVLLSHSFIFLGFIFINVYMILFLFDNVIYVFLLLWLCILIVCLCMANLTEVFPWFFLSCKANARVKPAKMGHGPHSS
jgi:hypothetical protein